MLSSGMQRYGPCMHDAAYKLLFSHPRMVEDLLRGFAAPGWSDSLDFATLEKLPSEFVSEDLRRRSGDGVWRVRFRDEWLYVLVLLEFQSTVDPHMALRILVYTGLLYQDLIRREAAGADGRLPPVLPVVLYNGHRPWTAPVDMSELIAPVGVDLARYQPVQRYFVLDGRRRGDHDLPWSNLVSAVVRLENSRTSADLKRAVDALVDWLPGPEQQAIKRSFREWIRLVLAQRGFDVSELPSRPQLEEVQTMLADRIKDWFDEAEEKGFTRGMARAMAQGKGPDVERRIRQNIEQGIEQGRAEERALLCRMAKRKFDAETAGQLAEILERVARPVDLGEIGEAIIECDTSAVLLDWASRVAPPSP